MIMVIFDLDGTLIETEATIAGVDNTLFEGIGLRIPGGADYVRTVMRGWSSRRKYDEAVRLSGATPCDEEYKAYRKARNAALENIVNEVRFPVHEGVHEFLTELKKKAWLAIASNNPHARAWTCVVRSDLDRYFTERMTFGSDQMNGKSKPEPDMITYPRRLQGIPANLTVMIGDSEADMIAARRAGVLPIAFLHKDDPDLEAQKEKLLKAGAAAIFSAFTPTLYEDVIVPALIAARKAATPRPAV